MYSHTQAREARKKQAAENVAAEKLAYGDGQVDSGEEGEDDREEEMQGENHKGVCLRVASDVALLHSTCTSFCLRHGATSHHSHCPRVGSQRVGK